MLGPEAFPAGAGAEPANAAIRSVMPLYEEHWWPEHQAISAARISAHAAAGSLIAKGSTIGFERR